MKKLKKQKFKMARRDHKKKPELKSKEYELRSESMGNKTTQEESETESEKEIELNQSIQEIKLINRPMATRGMIHKIELRCHLCKKTM